MPKMRNHNERLSDLFRQTSFPYNPAHSLHDLLDNKKIILYGGGEGSSSFSVYILMKYGLNACAVLDRKFKSGDTYCGIPAFSPHEYKPADEDKENAVVVITVGKREYFGEISGCLRSLGFKNIILSTDIYEYHLLNAPAELEKRGFNYYLDNRKRIMTCLDLFNDDLSREIFVRFMQTHMQRKPVNIPGGTFAEQYFPRDIALGKGYLRFINCGAYNGDTLKNLNALFGKIDAAACFEPDPDNFELLTRYLCANHNKIAHSVIAFPCGVFSHETQLHFADGNKLVSIISDKGESVIQCVALDHVLPGFKPTFIHMDVEGAEPAALKGADQLITENKPDLAISVYHSPNHIWDIPLYIDDLQLGYKFYLRNYTTFVNDTVLYATT